MKVILLEDVKGTGKKDDIVNVSDGFARNFLFPKKLAVQETAGAAKEIERKRAAARQREIERRQEAEKKAGQIRGKVVTLKAKCGSQGRLYGSVTGEAIAEALKEQYQVEVDKRKIEPAEIMRQVGECEMIVKLYPEVNAKMTLRVVSAE